MKTQIAISSQKLCINLTLILMLLLVGCQGNQTAATIPPGTYSATFTAADDIQVGDSLMIGTSSITFTESGDFTIRAPRATITGRYTVDEDQITFDEGTGTFPCIDMPSYVYKWNLQENTLTFSVVDDSCFPRTLAMTAKPYVMEE
ncbi:MAG TPA: hypothetical protein VK851_02420 [Anaerolineales bacterium]|nr:hypothetical protein [Anaerolineales bacterium]